MITETQKKLPKFDVHYPICEPNKISAPCYGSVTGPFFLRSMVKREEAEKYLKIIYDVEPFLIEFVGFNNGDEKEPVYYFELENYRKSYLIILGNLLKGINEHRYFQMPIALKEEEGLFFDRSFKYFKEMLTKISPQFPIGTAVRYGVAHQWWKYRMDPVNYRWVTREDEFNLGSVRTIEGVLEREKKVIYSPNGLIWDYCLDRLKDPVLERRMTRK